MKLAKSQRISNNHKKDIFLMINNYHKMKLWEFIDGFSVKTYLEIQIIKIFKLKILKN